MPCYSPIKAYQSFEFRHEKSGKPKIFFDRKKAGLSNPVELPCGQCIGCRIQRSKDWALRCVHEASSYESNCFITLTFNDDNLNTQGTLVKSDFQLFMKRLRKSFRGKESVEVDGCTMFPIRFFHCGEYGANLERPHHHACLFNFDFEDKELWSIRNGVKLYRSASLEKLWPFGFSTVGDVTFESAAYVSRYVTKKITGERATEYYCRVDDETGEIYNLVPEYITMSRRPGIGKGWFERFRGDVYPKDFVTLNGKKFKVPKYYDKIYDSYESQNFRRIKKMRVDKAKRFADNNTMWRLNTRRLNQLDKCKKLIRSMENGIEDL